MAVTPQSFPPRKRRPSAGAFVSPNFSDVELLRSLLVLSREIASLRIHGWLLRTTSLAVVRRVNLLSMLFEEMLRRDGDALCFSPLAILCFEEMYVLFQRIKAMMEDCSNGSKTWLLMQVELVFNGFRQLTSDLLTLLDVLPFEEFDLCEDAVELAALLRKRCLREEMRVDAVDVSLRKEVSAILQGIRHEVAPDHERLAQIFDRLDLTDSSSCREEMENLEEEIQSQTDERLKSEAIELIGLVRYAKCVLYGGSKPGKDVRCQRSQSNITVPSDFRCPITLDIIRDPVVVSTGQTYDRESITLWIQSGHNTCPKTGQVLVHTNLIPNRSLRNLIALWCRQQKIPFGNNPNDVQQNSLGRHKALKEAMKLMVSFLLQKLSNTKSFDVADGVVHELRVLSMSDSESRAYIAEAGAFPVLIQYLNPDVGSICPSLQINAVTTTLNLSILDANKARIVETEGALNGVIEILRSGATWESKGNAAATIYSLSSAPSYSKRLGRKTRVVKGLMDLVRDGPTTCKRDALAAISGLTGDRESVGKLLECGVLEVTCEAMESLQEEAVVLLEAVVKRGGLVAATAAHGAIRKLAKVLREGTDRARESAAATLVMICRRAGSESVAELAMMSGIERVIWELVGMGSPRAKRKASSLLRILRRWAAGLDGESTETYTATMTTTRTTTSASSTGIMLPS
ncbi:hypothetical protein MLD38_021522 [Melastoma candidum]|uniref:Uncharacterized protein n=1 Tax=Melastoma candidum TaxID=119954 RepID=A0ACB9QGF7_9MYRT|nr:hypothetical protein MLD38_021522 [Melastoma candidum]